MYVYPSFVPALHFDGISLKSGRDERAPRSWTEPRHEMLRLRRNRLQVEILSAALGYLGVERLGILIPRRCRDDVGHQELSMHGGLMGRSSQNGSLILL